jgi:hypothetical protein
MAKYVVTNPVIVINGGTVSASAASCTVSIEADDVETTNFGSAAAGFRERIGGLKSGTFDVEWHQDLAAGGIDDTVYALVGGTAAVKVRPGGTAAIGSANPEYEFNVLVTGWNPIDSAVGDLATVSTSWPVTGAIVRKTSA